MAIKCVHEKSAGAPSRRDGVQLLRNPQQDKKSGHAGNGVRMARTIEHSTIPAQSANA
jgi:hypothetical protein